MKATILTFLFSGMLVVGNKVVNKPEVIVQDKEFEELMKDFNQTLSKNKQVQVQADKAKEAIVTQTVSRVAQIKKEVKALKTELNEVKIKLDSVGVDTGSSFSIFAIPKG